MVVSSVFVALATFLKGVSCALSTLTGLSIEFSSGTLGIRLHRQLIKLNLPHP